jgi:hypothetical protein
MLRGERLAVDVPKVFREASVLHEDEHLRVVQLLQEPQQCAFFEELHVWLGEAIAKERGEVPTAIRAWCANCGDMDFLRQ